MVLDHKYGSLFRLARSDRAVTFSYLKMIEAFWITKHVERETERLLSDGQFWARIEIVSAVQGTDVSVQM